MTTLNMKTEEDMDYVPQEDQVKIDNVESWTIENSANEPELQLVPKQKARSVVWNYFGLLPDEDGNAVDDGKPICRRCLTFVPAKRGNTTNLFSHLQRRHPEIVMELADQSESSSAGDDDLRSKQKDCDPDYVPTEDQRFGRMSTHLTAKGKRKSVIWKFFGYLTDEKGHPIEDAQPVCRACYKTVRAKGGNTTNLFCHLKHRHPELVSELKNELSEQKSSLACLNGNTYNKNLEAVRESSEDHTDSNGSMALDSTDLPARPPILLPKENTRSLIWNYYGFPPDELGKPLDEDRPICKQCFKTVPAKNGHTSNLYQHLQYQHPHLASEVKQHYESVIPLMTPVAVMSPPLSTSNDEDGSARQVQALNRALAECICLNQLPVHIVETAGFRDLVLKLNSSYKPPGPDFFMTTEIPQLYAEARLAMRAQLSKVCHYSCSAELKGSVGAMDVCMVITVQWISDNWQMQSWCLGSAALNSEFSSETLREVLDEMVQEQWSLDLSKMTGITTHYGTNYRKAFSGYNWVPSFRHNLDVAVYKAVNMDRVAGSLSRIRKTVSAFTRSAKMAKLLLARQEELGLPQQPLVHDEPTHWSSTFDMVGRFIEQRRAVCALLDDLPDKSQLLPKESEFTALETFHEILSPLRGLSDLLSGEKDPMLSSVLPLSWKILSCLCLSDEDSVLARDMKEKISGELKSRYKNRELQILLNTGTFLDPRFKDTFVIMQNDVKETLLEKAKAIDFEYPPQTSCDPKEKFEEGPDPKRAKMDMKGFLSSIKTEKKAGVTEVAAAVGNHKLQKEIEAYCHMEEIGAEEDPLAWWRQNGSSLPLLSQCAQRYLCIMASASQHSDFACSSKRRGVSEENKALIDFLAKNLLQVKQLTSPPQ